MTGILPGHVPSTLVMDFDHHAGGIAVDPFATFDQVRGKRIFWTPAHGGFWVPTRHADIRAVLRDPVTFSSRITAIPAAGWPRPLLPDEMDPPEHGKYRALIVSCLTGEAARAIQAAIEGEVTRLIDRLAPAGACDLVTDFAQPLQYALFAGLFRVPREDVGRCFAWVCDLLQQSDTQRRSRAVSAIYAYLKQRIIDSPTRADDSAGEGFLGALSEVGIDGRPLTGDEALDIAFLMVMASLDTLASSLSFSFRYLAEHPGAQRRLAEDPGIAGRAADELLRMHSVVSIARTATRDTTLAGACIREGDRILLCMSLAGRDANVYPCPGDADFDRPNNKSHLAFGSGPHRCIGASIARRGLTTALREWHRHIPRYAIASDSVIRGGGGAVCSLDSLPVTWDHSATG
jgi:cytochrome P450